MKLAIASADFSRSIFDDDGHPVWGGSGWARLGQYLDRLPFETTVGMPVGRPESKGPFQCGVRTWSNSAYESARNLAAISVDVQNGGWNGEDKYGFDTVYFQRFMLAELAEDIPKFRSNGQVILNDLDDWYWGLDPTNNAFASLNVYDNENLSCYKRVIKSSDAVSVSTKYLADRITSWCKCPIEVLGNTVDFDSFKKRVHIDTMPIIGWAGSTSHRSRDLETMSGILTQLEGIGFTFRHVGHLDGAPSFMDVTGISHIETLPLLSPSEYRKSLDFDIGIVPLRDTPFNHAKSNIKGLEYVAANIPFVAPAFGEYKRLHDDFGVGRIAKNPKQWIQHLRALADPDVRQNEARTNLERATSFSISVGAKNLEAFIKTYSK